MTNNKLDTKCVLGFVLLNYMDNEIKKCTNNFVTSGYLNTLVRNGFFFFPHILQWKKIKQVAQLSQRNRAAVWVSFGWP